MGHASKISRKNWAKLMIEELGETNDRIRHKISRKNWAKLMIE
jgi:hypothetical protein